MLDTERWRITILVVKQIFQKINPLEDKELKEWMDGSAGNRRLVDEISEPGVLLRHLEEYEEVDKVAAWDKLAEKIPSLRSIPKEKIFPEHFAPVWQIWLRPSRHKWMAAALLLILAVAAFGLPRLFHIVSSHRQEESLAKQISNEPARAAELPRQYLQPGSYKMQITLPNGSIIDAASVPDRGMKTFGNMTIRREGQGTVVYQTLGHSNGNPSLNQVTTPKGGWYAIVLPDHTRVLLNAASSLSFMTSFGQGERNVTLQGEAYFEVAGHGADHPKRLIAPFIVNIDQGSGGMKVIATGTQFNVTAYKEDAIIRTTLLKGSVQVKDGKANSPTYLWAGDQHIRQMNGRTTLLHHVDTTGAAAWKNGRFAFRETPLTEIMRQLGRWYDASIQYIDTPQVSMNMTGLRSEPIDTLLKTMEETKKVHFMINDNGITISQPAR